MTDSRTGGDLPFPIRRRLGLLGHVAESEIEHLAHAHVPAWLRSTKPERRVTVSVAVLAAVALQLVLPSHLSLRPVWLLPAVEICLLIALVAMNISQQSTETRLIRVLSIVLTAVISLANAVSAGLLVHDLVVGSADTGNARRLLTAGGSIYLTNVIAFGLWYWEWDRGGPVARAHGTRHHADLLFPQMAVPELGSHDWEPTFGDYLYVSFTNATAFSPTDTMPLSRWAKLLMAVQSGVSLVTVGLVIARAVNILK